MSIPKAFISYSWDDEEHKAWVRSLATCLRQDGVDTMLDQWHIGLGEQLPHFMEKAVRDNDYVMIICTPSYKAKSDERRGGVGYEGDIMTAEVLQRRPEGKFIPVLRRGDWSNALPTWLEGRAGVDLRGDPYDEQSYSTLLEHLFGRRLSAPPLGRPPTLPPHPQVSEGEQTEEEQQLLNFLVRRQHQLGPGELIAIEDIHQAMSDMPDDILSEALEILEHDGLIRQIYAIGTGVYAIALLSKGWMLAAPKALGIDTTADLTSVLRFVVSKSEEGATGVDITEAHGLDLMRVSMTVHHLIDEGYIKPWTKTASPPYTFGGVTATTRGKRAVRTGRWSSKSESANTEYTEDL